MLATVNDDFAEWFTALFVWMNESEIDITLFFRLLSEVDLGAICSASIETLRPSFYVDPLPAEHETRLIEWLKLYAARTGQDGLDRDARKQLMNTANPRYVLRNYLAQEAIDLATQGDPSRIHLLLDVLRKPYDDQPEHAQFAAKRPE